MFLSILCVSCVVVVFPGQTQREGGWINGSRAAVVKVENYGAVISNNYGAMMNLQQCLSQEMLTDDSSKKGGKGHKKAQTETGLYCYLAQTIMGSGCELD